MQEKQWDKRTVGQKEETLQGARETLAKPEKAAWEVHGQTVQASSGKVADVGTGAESPVPWLGAEG